MIPHVILLFAAGALGFGLCEYKPTKKKEYLYISIVTVLMCAMIICRGENVGIDYDWIYRDIFLNINKNVNLGYIFSDANSYRSEPLFVLLNLAIAVVTDSPMVCFAVIGVLIVVLRTVFIAKYSPKAWISVFLYVALGFFSYSMCTVRQELAISMAMFSLPYLLDRKPIPYFAIILASGLMHNSLLMLIPIYFLVLIPPTKKWAIGLYSAGMLIIIIFSNNLLKIFTSTFKRFSFYSGDLTGGGVYLIGRNINTVIFWIVLLVVAAFFYKRLLAKDPKNMMLFNLYLFGTLVMTLTVKNFIFQRVALMLLPYSLILIAEIFDSLDFRKAPQMSVSKNMTGQKRSELKKKADDDKRMYYSILALFIFIAVMEFYFLMFANRLDLVPYVTFWM